MNPVRGRSWRVPVAALASLGAAALAVGLFGVPLGIVLVVGLLLLCPLLMSGMHAGGQRHPTSRPQGRNGEGDARTRP